jgi:DNA N-6-adenine-methyltransferase (Dam)
MWSRASARLIPAWCTMPHRQQSVGKSNEWYTPAHVFEAMKSSFDMDVSSPGAAVTWWIPATRFVTAESLERPWEGFIWMNPPFGGRNGKLPWLEKFFSHGNGVALLPDRTSAPWWQAFAPRADLILFVAPKLKFLGPNAGDSPAQGTTLFALGPHGCQALHNARRAGLGVLMVPV